MARLAQFWLGTEVAIAFGRDVALARLRRLSLASATLLVGLAFLLFSWIPGPPVRPEQFTLPKDAALGVLGVVCCIQLMFRPAVPWDTPIDAPLAAAVCWGALLTAMLATNTDLAWRSIGSLSAAMSLFLLARRVGAESGTELIHLMTCFVVAVMAALVLLEAFGGVRFICGNSVTRPPPLIRKRPSTDTKPTFRFGAIKRELA